MGSQIKSEFRYLSLTRDQCLADINTTSDVNYDTLAVGAAILHNGESILLLKRQKKKKHYPNVYEIPAGKVKATTRLTIGDAIEREVPRLTKHKVISVLRPLSAITYSTASGIDTHNVIQLNYVVQVEADSKWRRNHMEHSDGIWANKTTVETLEDITEEMKGVAMEALASA